MVSCFRESHSKVLEHFRFFRNRGKFENRHFGSQPPLKIAENCAFLFARTYQRHDIYVLGSL